MNVFMQRKKNGSLRGVLTFVASGLDINAVCWVILKGQQMYTITQAVHTLLYIVEKCNFFSVVPWKYNKLFTKMWGVYSLLWDTVCKCIYKFDLMLFNFIFLE